MAPLFSFPGSLAIISATFDDAERGRAIGTWSGFSAITTAIGPVTGGWLIEHVSWRAVFFLNVPLAAAVVVCRCDSWTRAATRPVPRESTGLGAALGVAGLGGLVFGLLEWPPLGAGHPIVLSAIAIGVVSLILLAVVEQRASSPMLPIALFQSRPFTLANVLTLLLYAAMGVVMFLAPLNFIQVQRYTATAAGAALLPFAIIMFTLSRWSGGLVARVGSRLPLTVGPAVAAVGLALYARPGIGGSVLDDLLSGHRRARRRHGDHGRASDDDRDGRRRSATCRRGVGCQQRGIEDRRPDGDRGVRGGDVAQLRCSRRSANRPSGAVGVGALGSGRRAAQARRRGP